MTTLVALALVIVKESAKFPYEWRKKLPSCLRRNQKVSMSNVALRFGYQVFLELLICVLLVFKLSDLSSGMAKFQFFVSICIVLVMMAAIGLLAAKFCKSGPYMTNYFEKLTLNSLCCLSTRQVKSDYDYRDWLHKYKKLRVAKLKAKNDPKYLALVKKKKARNKPQHKIRIKGNQCQPENQIEEPVSTQRHLLDTAEDP